MVDGSSISGTTETPPTQGPESRGELIARGAPEDPATVGVVPITGGACLVPPRPANREDMRAFFKPGVKRLYFLRGPWSVRGHVEGATRIISVPWSSLLQDSVRVCQRG